MTNEWRKGTVNKTCFSLVLRAAYDTAREFDLPANRLFHNTGLDKFIFEDPYTVIGRHQALTFYKNMVEVGPLDIGLHVGLRSSSEGRGSHGHLLSSTDTMESTTLLGKKYYDILYLHVAWNIVRKGNMDCHQFTEEFPLGIARQFCIDRTLVLLYRGGESYAGSGMVPDLIRLDTPRPPYYKSYEELFQSDIVFDQEITEVRYSAKEKHRRVVSYDPLVLESTKMVCEQLLTRLHGKTDIVSDVRRAIHANPGRFPNIEQVSEFLGCSSRTLRRRLTKRGDNFQRILDEERSKVAADYLANSELSIQDIADCCGFTSPQNFAYAFRRWTGLSPSQYRANSISV